MSGKKSHIVLIGFMGSGKSTIGKMLAESLNRPYIDTDHDIAKAEKMSISEIFDLKGEKYFREIESNILQNALKSKIPSIIATGGGAPCNLNGINYIQKYSYSFYLKVGRITLLERIYGDKSRPLVKAKTKRELKQFINLSISKREVFYQKSNQTIMAYNLPEKIVGRITKYIDKQQI